MKEKNKHMRKDRTRAKKQSHKLTKRHVEMIRLQEGNMSIRKTCKWFRKKTHGVYTVSPRTVYMIWKGDWHKEEVEQENMDNIFDLIEAAKDMNDGQIDDLLEQVDKINYEN